MAPADQRPRVFLLAACDPASDPRIGWLANTLSQRFAVTEIGIFREPNARTPTIEQLAHGARIRVPVSPWPGFVEEDARSPLFADNAGWATLAAFGYETAQMEDLGLLGAGADASGKERRAQMGRILRTNASLVRAARALGPAELVVAADFDALAAAVVVKQDFGARLLYDAHEFWPFAFPQFDRADEELWVRIERRLVQATDARFAVSPQLAAEMGRTYAAPFIALPNAAPLSDAPQAPMRRKDGGKLEFLFLGGFAPDRGLDLLINAWAGTPPECVLVMQGPGNAYRDAMIHAARRTGLFGPRILFPEPIAESALIPRAADADVGLVPYEPTLLNHKFCSPNKISQYMAARLPILANRTEFVAQIIHDSDCGVVIDFKEPGAIVSAVTALAQDRALRDRLGDNGRAAFETRFNWDVFSPAVLAAAGDPMRNAQPGPADIATVLRRVFTTSARRRDADGSDRPAGLQAAGRLALRIAWHGLPFLRLIVLSNARLRLRAEMFREL
jgi:glycosyltransferase involved in cell wall biosynthesis